MKLTAFEKLLIPGTILGLILNITLALGLKSIVRLSEGTSTALIYAMLFSAALILAADACALLQQIKGKKVKFGIIGMVFLAAYFAGFAIFLLSSLRSGDISVFMAFQRDHAIPLAGLATICLALYVIFERPKLTFHLFET